MGKVADLEGMRRVFSQRLHEVVDRVVETADLATIEKVLSMADPFSGMGVAMHQAATTDAAALRDPLAGARLRGVEAREQLIDEAGGLLRLSQVADRLGVTPQAVTGRRLRETILAVPMPNGEWVYPACQFADVDLVSGIDAFVRAFADDVDPWTKLSVLIAPSRRFGGKSALDLLSAGRKDEATSIAGTYGVQG
jgi:hypothetical protein